MDDRHGGKGPDSGAATGRAWAQELRQGHAADAVPTVFQKAISIAFDTSNINVCFLQQVKVFREWWVVAETRRQLGAVSFCREQVVHPQHRRPAQDVAKPLLQTIWQQTAQKCGPASAAHAAPMRVRPGAAATHADMDSQVGLLRSERRSHGYGLRTVLGKSIYWLPGYAALIAMCEHAMRGQEALEVSDEAYKCSLRFLHLRLALAGAVLDEEAQAQAAGEKRNKEIMATGYGNLRACLLEEEEVAEVLRACPQPVLTHTMLRNKLGRFRTRRTEISNREVFSFAEKRPREQAAGALPAALLSQRVVEEVQCKQPKSDALAYNPAGALGSGGGPGEGASSSGNRGPAQHHTNFDLVTAVLGQVRLPPSANIYYVEQRKAGVLTSSIVTHMAARRRGKLRKQASMLHGATRLYRCISAMLSTL